jgi:coenzyme F420 hydrogenase subunit beta
MMNQRLLQVIDGGFCVGCGACAAVTPRVAMQFDEAGRYVARPDSGSEESETAAAVCPFADGTPDEDQLGRELFSAYAVHDPHLGYSIATYAGWVNEDGFRERGSSGGLGSWILCELLRQNHVDAVVHVVAGSRISEGGPLFEYGISTSVDRVLTNAKSRYYPIELSEAIAAILQTPARYAVVGIPCFLKALRLSARQNPLLRERITYTVGLVCGHLKSQAFAEMLGWQCGIPPADLQAIDFRRKISGRGASNYGITAVGRSAAGDRVVEKANTELYGSNWGLGYFKYKACDFCDDVMAELADVTVGDAWLPEYEPDSRGTNIVVARLPFLARLLEAAAAEGRIHLEALAKDRVIASQAGGFRHRRDGLRYRLWLADQAGWWRPKKRVAPSASHLSARDKKIFELRSRLAEQSHTAFLKAKQAGKASVFERLMEPLRLDYDALYTATLWRRVAGKVKRGIIRVARLVAG